MPEELAEQPHAKQEQRRSQRVMLRMAVLVEGKSESGPPFLEETHTLVVNAHGCLVTMATVVKPDQSVVLTNKATGQKQACHVVYQGTPLGGRMRVGIAFNEPAAEFWQIAFPPEDWKAVPT